MLVKTITGCNERTACRMVKPVVWKCILEETADTVTHWQSHHVAAYKVPWDHFPGFQMMGTGISMAYPLPHPAVIRGDGPAEHVLFGK